MNSEGERIHLPSFHLIRALASAGPIACVIFLTQSVLAGFTGPVTALASGALIAGITAGNDRQAEAAAIALGIAFAAEPLMGALRGVLGNRLGMRLDQLFRDRVMAAALTPQDISVLENPATADLLTSPWGADLHGEPMREIVISSGLRFSQWIRVVVMAAILSGYLPWAGPLLVAAALTATWLAPGTNEEYVEARRKPESRLVMQRGDYYESLAIDPPAAKEIRVFGLGEFFAGRLAALREQYYDHVRAIRRAALPRKLVGVAVRVLPAGAVLTVIGAGLLAGHVSAAALAVQVQAVFGILAVFSRHSDDSWHRSAGYTAARIRNIEARLQPARPQGASDRKTADSRLFGPPAIRFRGVTFSYHGAPAPVLQQLDLEIPAGRSLALVGLNGAGKTTVIKLLAGLYRPHAGRILVDGEDLAEVDAEAWWSRLAIVFQDFLRLELSARENVAFDGSDEARLNRVGSDAALNGVISALPRGWDTTLSRSYRGGTDLSGGEWQRIALARALHAVERGAQLIVLDEPTAHLDVRAEAATFERLLELTSGLTTVLVSHRYSTVRRADRVAVLEGGRIVEAGSPAELLRRRSRYARMFRDHRILAEEGR